MHAQLHELLDSLLTFVVSLHDRNIGIGTYDGELRNSANGVSGEREREREKKVF